MTSRVLEDSPSINPKSKINPTEESSSVFRMLGSKVIYNHNSDPNVDLNSIKMKFNRPPYDKADNSWNKQNRYIGHKLYQDYIQDKNKRDHNAAVSLLS